MDLSMLSSRLALVRSLWTTAIVCVCLPGAYAGGGGVILGACFLAAPTAAMTLWGWGGVLFSPCLLWSPALLLCTGTEWHRTALRHTRLFETPFTMRHAPLASFCRPRFVGSVGHTQSTTTKHKTTILLHLFQPHTSLSL